jgi:hypothetical protein
MLTYSAETQVCHRSYIIAARITWAIPYRIKIKKLCFWNKIVGNTDKLSGKIYRLLFKLFISGNRDIPWMNYVKSIFDETGFSNIWDG